MPNLLCLLFGMKNISFCLSSFGHILPCFSVVLVCHAITQYRIQIFRNCPMVLFSSPDQMTPMSEWVTSFCTECIGKTFKIFWSETIKPRA